MTLKDIYMENDAFFSCSVQIKKLIQVKDDRTKDYQTQINQMQELGEKVIKKVKVSFPCYGKLVQ